MADPISEADLDLLDDYLMSGRAPDDARLIPDLDGYLTAIALSPAPIPVADWLPGVWGGTPAFGSAEEEGAVHQVLFDRLAEIGALSEAGSCSPLLDHDQDDEPIATDWALGFLDGMALRPDAWLPLLDSPTQAGLLDPVFVLALEPDELPPHLQFDPADEPATLRAAAHALPEHIVRIAAFWRDA